MCHSRLRSNIRGVVLSILVTWNISSIRQDSSTLSILGLLDGSVLLFKTQAGSAGVEH